MRERGGGGGSDVINIINAIQRIRKLRHHQIIAGVLATTIFTEAAMFIVLHAPYNRYYRARGTIEEKMIRRKPERGRERERRRR